jgi:addiction module RelE/StbE family toxin
VNVEFSPEAQADLDEIADFIARDDPDAAESWIERLIDRAERLAFAPRAGRVVPEVRDKTIREVTVGNYRLVYRLEATRVLVLTVFEGHRRLRL